MGEPEAAAAPVKPRGGRDLNIDTIRGLACMGVVAFHVAGGQPTSGMELPADHYLHGFNHAFTFLRMPVFAMMAGLFWRSFPQTRADLSAETKKRLQHIALPALTVSLLFFFGHAIKRGDPPITAGNLAYAVFHNGTYLWFMQSLLTLMLGGMLLAYLFRRHRRPLIWALFILSAATFPLVDLWKPSLFSWRSTMYLAPYFFLGDLFRESFRRTGPPAIRALGAVFVGVAIVAGLWGWRNPDFVIEGALTTALGVTGAVGLLMLRPRIPLVAKLGPRSFKVYLYHIFFTNIALVIWRKLVPGAPLPLVFLGGVLLGVTGPIIMERALAPVPKLRMLLFGK